MIVLLSTYLIVWDLCFWGNMLLYHALLASVRLKPFVDVNWYIWRWLLVLFALTSYYWESIKVRRSFLFLHCMFQVKILNWNELIRLHICVNVIDLKRNINWSLFFLLNWWLVAWLYTCFLYLIMMISKITRVETEFVRSLHYVVKLTCVVRLLIIITVYLVSPCRIHVYLVLQLQSIKVCLTICCN